MPMLTSKERYVLVELKIHKLSLREYSQMDQAS
jgi:hypothetical protein